MSKICEVYMKGAGRPIPSIPGMRGDGTVPLFSLARAKDMTADGKLNLAADGSVPT